MTDERPEGDEQTLGVDHGAHPPDPEAPALFPTEGLAPGEDVEGGRLADLAKQQVSQQPAATEDSDL